MNPKKLKKLKKQVRHRPLTQRTSPYMTRINHYYQQFSDYPKIKFLLSHIIMADNLLQNGQLPQDLPLLQLPDDSQDTIFHKINAAYPAGSAEGDRLWDHLSAALPALDQDLRDFRDYLEDHYGMWAYTSAGFVSDLATFVGDRAVLEVMAGNGYISRGLRNAGKTVFATDSKDWVTENQTGKHPLTPIETLDALTAFATYQHQVGVVVMSWSPDGLPLDWELLQAIRASHAAIDFVVIGEPYGATGSKAFWDHADLIDNEAVTQLNRHFINFDLIQDHVYLVR